MFLSLMSNWEAIYAKFDEFFIRYNWQINTFPTAKKDFKTSKYSYKFALELFIS